MESFFKETVTNLKNKLPFKKKVKSWNFEVARKQNQNKDITINSIERDFDKILNKLILNKIEKIGETEGGGEIIQPVIEETIGETEGGGEIIKTKDLNTVDTDTLKLFDSWKEKIKNEKSLSIQEKSHILYHLLRKKAEIEDAIYKNLNNIDYTKIKQDVFNEAEKFEMELSQNTSPEKESDVYIEKIQQLAENYNQEENSDDSMRQAVNLIGKISINDNTEPKKLISDLLDIFGESNKENIVEFYKQLFTFFEATENIKNSQNIETNKQNKNKEENTQIIGNPPILNT